MADLGPANDWRPVLLGLIRAPVNKLNLLALALWAQSEGMDPRYNNPLATTEPGFGGTSINSQGVKHYPTPQAGGQATAKTLQNGYYTAVIRELRRSFNMGAIYSAINQSPWCHGCQNGTYPVAMANYLQGGHPDLGPGGLQPTTPPPPSKNVTDTGWDYAPVIRSASSGLGGHAGHAEDAVRATRRQLGG